MDYHTHNQTPDQRAMLWLETGLICVSCLHRWVAVRPVGSDFNRMQCPQCEAFRSELVGEYNACRMPH